MVILSWVLEGDQKKEIFPFRRGGDTAHTSGTILRESLRQGLLCFCGLLEASHPDLLAGKGLN
jgi:hypothetical protein